MAENINGKLAKNSKKNLGEKSKTKKMKDVWNLAGDTAR